jgi:CBS domain containing-hemolysin-like protein
MAKHIKKVIDFHDTTVQEIMTPRVRVEAIKSTATVNETYQRRWIRFLILVYQYLIEVLMK